MKPSGRYWRTDSQGNLLNDAHFEHIQAPFQQVLQDCIAAYTQHIEADLHSLYITGSIPRGRAVVGQSDIDVFGVLEYSVDPELVKQDWLPLAEASILKSHAAVVSDVQLELWPQGFIFRDPTEFSIGAFIIATHAVCVWGSDVTSELPTYNLQHRLTRLAIANDDIFNLPYDIDEAWERLEIDTSAENIRYWCKRICKNMIRTGFSLVMEEVKAHTRDLDLCVENFCHYYPAQAADMRQCEQWVQQPTTDLDALLDHLDTHGEWLVDQCETWMDTHNPERHECFPLDTEEEI